MGKKLVIAVEYEEEAFHPLVNVAFEDVFMHEFDKFAESFMGVLREMSIRLWSEGLDTLDEVLETTGGMNDDECNRWLSAIVGLDGD